MADKTAISTNKSKLSSAQLGKLWAESLKSIGNMPIIGALVAEFVGSFLLASIFIIVSGQPLYVAFALIGIVLFVGGISGAHLNPAITVGAFVTRKIGLVRTIGYIAVQVLGAVLAWVVLDAFSKGGQSSAQILLSGSQSQLFSATDIATIAKEKEWYLFFAEFLGATILSLGIATAIRAKRDKVTAALSQSFAILVALIIAGSATAVYATGLTFLNPAIASVVGALSWNTWPIAIYVVAPIIGAIIGFALQDFLRLHSEKSQN